MQESACGCAGIYSAPVALQLYAHAFELAGALDKFETFSSLNGPAFYGLPVKEDTITLTRLSDVVPKSFDFGDTSVVPMWTGQKLV